LLPFLCVVLNSGHDIFPLPDNQVVLQLKGGECFSESANFHPCSISSGLSFPSTRTSYTPRAKRPFDDFCRLWIGFAVMSWRQHSWHSWHCTVIRLEQSNMEYIMKSSARRQFQFVCDLAYSLHHAEWSIELGTKLASAPNI
jgi:hypothetical protein